MCASAGVCAANAEEENGMTRQEQVEQVLKRYTCLTMEDRGGGIRYYQTLEQSKLVDDLTALWPEPDRSQAYALITELIVEWDTLTKDKNQRSFQSTLWVARFMAWARGKTSRQS